MEYYFVLFQLSNFLAIYVQCFSMDEQRSKAVTEAFVRLYKDGLIYRLVFHNLESSVICMWYLWFYIDKVLYFVSLLCVMLEFSHLD
jgi:hypothetical protein